MNFNDEDLKLWQNFTKKLDLSKNIKLGKISEKGKKFVNAVKENMKSQVNFKEFDDIKNLNTEFIIEKGSTLGIDRLSDKKLNRGKYKIDYKIDLHGLTLESAYNKVHWLFEKASIENYKCVLIITGKGLHSRDKTIKSSIVDWFKEPYFSDKIIKYMDAHLNHGGSGAVYVLLRNL